MSGIGDYIFSFLYSFLLDMCETNSVRIHANKQLYRNRNRNNSNFVNMWQSPNIQLNRNVTNNSAYMAMDHVFWLEKSIDKKELDVR